MKGTSRRASARRNRRQRQGAPGPASREAARKQPNEHAKEQQLEQPSGSPEDSPLADAVGGHATPACADAGEGRAPGTAVSGDHPELVARLYRTFLAQMDHLEARLRDLESQTGEALRQPDLGDIDKTVKTLASLARTLTVLMDLEAEPAKGSRQNGRKDADEGSANAGDELDPDRLRDALAQRLEGLRQGRAD
ncbi:hypothetical protein [Roseibium aestuarii]|uniref:Uncharacterized protein n=1 Tax=Roseibium aestuarii TaxID=2600299 RepID=A0ABW4JRZ6_9HYPH|nr:hypothetical protein [Roseibium aestuarii]